jgi:hypothetical protein
MLTGAEVPLVSPLELMAIRDDYIELLANAGDRQLKWLRRRRFANPKAGHDSALVPKLAKQRILGWSRVHARSGRGWVVKGGDAKLCLYHT